jgi:hypothetical protein
MQPTGKPAVSLVGGKTMPLILWLLGVPITVILILMLLGVIHF